MAGARLFACLAALIAAPVVSHGAETTQGGWSAEFQEPTHRYGHGIMGDLPEWGRLCLSGKDGQAACVTLPERRVFEDMAPRLADLDRDGTPEAVVVESDATQGAALVVYRLAGAELQRIATPPIGRAFRWLAPAGIADLDGDGYFEIAYVDRPHLAKTLRIWRYRDAALTEVAAAKGLTNHRIGETTIAGGIRDCGDTPEVITADAGWSRLVATTLDADKLTHRDIGPHKGRGSFKAAMACKSP